MSTELISEKERDDVTEFNERPYVAEAAKAADAIDAEQMQAEAEATVAISQADDEQGIGSQREETFAPTGEGPLADLMRYEQVHGIGYEKNVPPDGRQAPHPKVVTGTLRILEDRPLGRQVSVDGFVAEVAEMTMPMVRQLADTVIVAELINNPDGWWWLHNVEGVQLLACAICGLFKVPSVSASAFCDECRGLRRVVDDAGLLRVWEASGSPIPARYAAPEPSSFGWRRLDAEVQAEFLRWAEDQLSQRLAIGEQEYQSHILGFQGDPLWHGIKEQLDGLFYSWMQLRQREAGRGAVDDRVLVLLWEAYCDQWGKAGHFQKPADAIDDFVYWLTHNDPSVVDDQLPALREAWRRFVGDPEAGQPAGGD